MRTSVFNSGKLLSIISLIIGSSLFFLFLCSGIPNAYVRNYYILHVSFFSHIFCLCCILSSFLMSIFIIHLISQWVYLDFCLTFLLDFFFTDSIFLFLNFIFDSFHIFSFLCCPVFCHIISITAANF